MNSIRKLLGDSIGLFRACGFPAGLKWLWCLLRSLPEILRRRSLEPADRCMGEGPFEVRVSGRAVRFAVSAPSVVSGIRETLVRDVYLGRGALSIADGDTVLDLGANVGNFTNLALAHGKDVRVVAVEPSLALNTSFLKSVGLNAGFLDRTRLIRAFVGIPRKLHRDLMSDNPNYADAPWLTEEALMESAGLEHVDFLKCDIEGGEFGLLTDGCRLLQASSRIAMEVHSFAGDVHAMLDRLEGHGFGIVKVQWAPDGSCTVLARRGGT